MERKVVSGDHKVNATENRAVNTGYVGSMDTVQGKAKQLPLLAVSNS